MALTEACPASEPSVSGDPLQLSEFQCQGHNPGQEMGTILVISTKTMTNTTATIAIALIYLLVIVSIYNSVVTYNVL